MSITAVATVLLAVATATSRALPTAAVAMTMSATCNVVNVQSE